MTKAIILRRPDLGKSGARGFTLIEVMTVVAILGILAAIALPSYTAYIQRGYRANAKTTLLEAAQFMERHRSANFHYATSAGVAPTLPANLLVSPAEGTKRYDISLSVTLNGTGANARGTGFTLTATPAGWTDTRCASLTLDNLGQKGMSAAATDTVDNCWNK